MKYNPCHVIYGTLCGERIRYRITEIDSDTIYATDCDTGKNYAWDKCSYEFNNQKKTNLFQHSK